MTPAESLPSEDEWGEFVERQMVREELGKLMIQLRLLGNPGRPPRRVAFVLNLDGFRQQEMREEGAPA